MDFSEFKRKLGAEPRSNDPEFVAACDASPEHRDAAIEAERFEGVLDKAFDIPVPQDVPGRLLSVTRAEKRRSRWPLALAASVLVAVGASAILFKTPRNWESIEAYVMDHYRHDGASVLERAADGPSGDVQEILGSFGLQAAPALAGRVALVKYCPAPGGKGVHMVLDTEAGPVTVFYLPKTDVNDREKLNFDGLEAMLVSLERGSAVIIGNARPPEVYYAMVHDSIVPIVQNS